MKKPHWILGAVGSLITLSAHAAEQTKVSTITDVYPMANGSFVISIADVPTQCTNTSTPKRLTVKVGENSITAEALQQIFAASLTAMTTDITVYVAYDD